MVDKVQSISLYLTTRFLSNARISYVMVFGFNQFFSGEDL
jgi:hypothetical protein